MLKAAEVFEAGPLSTTSPRLQGGPAQQARLVHVLAVRACSFPRNLLGT